MHLVQRRRFANSAAVVSLLSLINLAVGFLLQVVMAAYFGANATMDAYLAASTIPSMVNLVFVGALNVTVVPLYIDYCTKHDRHEAWKVINSTINSLAVLLILLSVLIGIQAQPLMSLITPGLKNFGQLALAANLLILMLPSMLFTGISGILTGVYYAEKRFFLPSVALVVNNVVALGVTLSLVKWWGIQAVAVGALAGSIIQFILCFFPQKAHYRVEWHIQHEGYLRLVMLALPWIFGSLVGKLNPLVDRMIASNLTEGAISHLGFAFLVIMAVTTVTGKGLSVTVLPIMSEFASRKNFQQLSELYSTSIRRLILILGLTSIWMVVGSQGLIKILFERREFTASDTAAVSMLTIAFLGYYIFGALGVITANALYSMQNTLLPAGVAVIGFPIYIVLALGLSAQFGIVGLALATSLEYFFNIVLSMLILRQKLKELQGKALFLVIAKVLFAAIVAVTTSQLFLSSTELASHIMLSSIVKILCSTVIYISALLVLKCEEFTQLITEVTTQIKTTTKRFQYAK